MSATLIIDDVFVAGTLWNMAIRSTARSLTSRPGRLCADRTPSFLHPWIIFPLETPSRRDRYHVLFVASTLLLCVILAAGCSSVRDPAVFNQRLNGGPAKPYEGDGRMPIMSFSVGGNCDKHAPD